MIEVSKRLFIEKKALTKKDIKLAKVAAIAAVLVSTKDNRIYQITKAEGTGRWRAIAKIEALNRRLYEE
jgi:hypothetical protein